LARNLLFFKGMKTNDDKEWRELCEQVANETDHHKLMELADKINRVLEQREEKLRRPLSGTLPRAEGNETGKT
jgi:hypothetical protein